MLKNFLQSKKQFAKRVKWQIVLSAFFLILAGIFCIISPQSTSFFVITTAFGLLAILSILNTLGIGSVFEIVTSLVVGVFSICVCVLCFYNFALAQRLVLVILGLVLITSSLKKLFYGISFVKEKIQGGSFYIVLSVLTFLLGLGVMFVSFTGFMTFCGVVLIVSSVCDIVTTIVFSSKIKKLEERLTKIYSYDKYDIKNYDNFD